MTSSPAIAAPAPDTPTGPAPGPSVWAALAAAHADLARTPHAPAVRARFEAALAALAPTLVPLDQRAQTLRTNLAAIASHPGAPALTARVDAWLHAEAAFDLLLTHDHNLIRRHRPSPAHNAYRWLRDHRADAHALAASPHLAAAAHTMLGPITIEGLAPPFIALAAHHATPRLAIGYQPILRLVQLDPDEFLLALSLHDLTDLLTSPRTRVYVGPTAAADLAADVAADPALAVNALTMRTPELTAALVPSVDTVIAAADQQQRRLAASVTSQLAARASARDRIWWARRYTEATAPNSPAPLRVLIPTSRFTTFVQHAADDLAHALTALGHHPLVTREPHDHALTTSLFHAQHALAFDPDLVLTINYPRSAMARSLPDHVPLLCWVQDAMTHLLSPEVHALQQPHDYFAGYLGPSLFHGGRVPPRSLPCPVPVSTHKFHPGPVDPTLRDRLACDLAYISNQSEPPRALVDRLRAMAAATPDLAACFDEALRLVEPAVANALLIPAAPRLQRQVQDLVRQRLRRHDPQLAATLFNAIVLPVADRVFRHQTLAWIAELAARHNLRFHLYGQGWHNHPALARFAKGPLAHGEPLRAAYAAATVNLHMSFTVLQHQRVFEAAFSGSLPLCRLRRDDFCMLEADAARELLATAAPVRTLRVNAPELAHAHLFDPAHSPKALAVLDQLHRCGIHPVNNPHAHHAGLWCADIHDPNPPDPTTRHLFRAWPFAIHYLEQLHKLPHDPVALNPLGDLPDLGFWDPASLERQLLRAINNPADARARAHAIADRARPHLSTAAVLRTVLGTITADLTATNHRSPRTPSLS